MQNYRHRSGRGTPLNSQLRPAWKGVDLQRPPYLWRRQKNWESHQSSSFINLRYRSPLQSSLPPPAYVTGKDRGNLYLEDQWVLIQDSAPEKILAVAEVHGSYGKFNQLQVLVGLAGSGEDWDHPPFVSQLHFFITGLFLMAPVDYLKLWSLDGGQNWPNHNWGEIHQMYSFTRPLVLPMAPVSYCRISRNTWFEREATSRDLIDLRYLERRGEKPERVLGHRRKRSLMEILFGKKR